MFSFRIDESLVLRLAEERDAEALQSLIEEDRARLRTWLPWVDDATLETTREHIRDMRLRFARGEGLLLLILHGGEVAGLVGFNTIEGPPGKAEVGYWLGGRFEGAGIMTRAVDALLEYGFEHLGLYRIELRAAVGNRRSRAVAERLGFQEEGTIRGDALLHGRHVDHAVYGILAPEWNARGPHRLPGNAHSSSGSCSSS